LHRGRCPPLVESLRARRFTGLKRKLFLTFSRILCEYAGGRGGLGPPDDRPHPFDSPLSPAPLARVPGRGDNGNALTPGPSPAGRGDNGNRKAPASLKLWRTHRRTRRRASLSYQATGKTTLLLLGLACSVAQYPRRGTSPRPTERCLFSTGC